MRYRRLTTAFGLVAASAAMAAAQNDVAPLPPISNRPHLADRAAFHQEPANQQPRQADPEPLAQPPQRDSKPAPLTLADAEQIALGNHPALARAAARIAAARGEWLQSGLKPNPIAGYSGEEMGDDDTAGKQGAFVSQEIVTAGKLGLDRAVAGREIRRAEAELEAMRFRVLSDVRAAFHAALVAKETVRMLEDLVRISDEGLKTTDTLHQKGELTRVDLLQARVEANRTRLLFDTARNRQASALRRLSAVLGNSDPAPLALTGDANEMLPELSWDEALGRVIGESPEIAAAQAMVDKASWTLARAQVEWIPNIDFEVGVHHDNATQEDMASVQIGVPLPIFNRNQGNIQKAQAELAAAHSDVVRVELDLKRRLAQVFENYDNARRRVGEYQGKILPDAKESLDLVNVLYRNGEVGYLTLLTTQRTYIETHLSNLEALRELHEAAAMIDNLLLEGSLEER